MGLINDLSGQTALHYPESDGKPMADNTKQYELMVMLRENLDCLLPDFVAANLFWYPVEGAPRIVQAPDVMVAFGRPKGDRRSYKQWEEEGVAPEVVVEVLSDSNSWPEMARKGPFYLRHGAREFYILDPETLTIAGWIAEDDGLLTEVTADPDWESPRLGIRLRANRDTGAIEVFAADGARFLSFREIKERAEEAQSRAEKAEAELDRLAAKLRELGIDPASV